MEFLDYLTVMVKNDASDLYLSTHAYPSAKVNGILHSLEKTPLPPGRVKSMAYGVMTAEQIAHFEQKPEMNLALDIAQVGRFRVNIFKQRNEVSMVVRQIKTAIPSTESLGLPDILQKIILSKRGLVLFIGATGSGKSTSLASLIDYRNQNHGGHIITIEDPIEFVHAHKRSIINQREVGVDTDSYEDALVNTLRQAPDVILIGEVRSRETMEHAIAFAETGHLAISTLHANNANQALDRIINFFPEDRRNQLLLDLSLNLRAFISQRLVQTRDGKRVAAFEILLGTPLVRDMIHRGNIADIREVMEKSENVGMQTFDSSLFKLYREGLITQEEALRNSDAANNLRLKMTLAEKDALNRSREKAEKLTLVLEDKLDRE